MKTFNITMCMLIGAHPATGAYLEYDMHGDVLNLFNHTIVADGAWLDFENIKINESAYINNRGHISGNIFVCDGCDMYIRNAGQIDGEIITGPDAHVTQIVHTGDELTPLNVTGPYDMMVYRASDLSWTDIKTMSFGAGKIILVDSSVVMSADTAPRAYGIPAPIELVGNNDLYLRLDTVDLSAPILQNIMGNGTFHIHAENINPLYALRAVIRNGDLYADLVRETDYLKILGTDTGRFLNTMRMENPDDNLLHHLDRARTVPELHHILNKSMRINIAHLNRPLRTFNRQMHNITFSNEPLFADPFVILGRDIDAYGTRAGTGFDIMENIRGYFGAHAGYMNFSDGMDDYGADIVGLSGGIRMDGAHFALLTDAGISYARFETMQTTAGKKPRGTAAYINIDGGPAYAVTDKLRFVPIVGLGAEYARVYRTSQTSAIRAGCMAEYKYKTLDLEYSYSFRAGTSTANVVNASADIMATSVDDDMSGRVSVGLLNDEMGVSYTVSASVQFGF